MIRFAPHHRRPEGERAQPEIYGAGSYNNRLKRPPATIQQPSASLSETLSDCAWGVVT
jgi:hypothetical protein